MKKTLVIAVTALSLFTITSCHKFAMTETNDVSSTEETVNVTVKANEVYSYSLPENTDVAAIELSTPAAKSAVAIVETIGTTSNFVYTPDANFSGTDVVVLNQNTGSQSTTECHPHHHKKHHHGSSNSSAPKHHTNESNPPACGNSQPKCGSSARASKHKITFNITVLSAIN